MNELMNATRQAHIAGQLTIQQNNAVMTALAIDWKTLLSALPILATFFPPIAPFIPLITWLVGLLTNPKSIPLPIPDNGGEDPPVPVIQ